MKATDCARALHVLQNKALLAAANARDDAAMRAVQVDIVTGARRLEAACTRLGADPVTCAQVQEYRAAAEAVLARIDAHAARPPALSWRRRGLHA